jgi:hypothetical protein
MRKEKTVERINHDLELHEQIDTHIRSWKLQRVGWICMFVVTLGALLGLCGSGPLSYRTGVVNNDTLKYEYFLRYESHAELKLRLQHQTGITRIAVPNSYWENFQVEKIIPDPFDTQQNNDSLLYFFRGTEKGLIQFFLVPQERGAVKGTILVNNGAFPVSHFIYP